MDSPDFTRRVVVLSESVSLHHGRTIPGPPEIGQKVRNADPHAANHRQGIIAGRVFVWPTKARWV